MSINEPKSFEDLFNQFFTPGYKPYTPFVPPVVQPPQFPAGETTTSTTPKVKPAHPHDEAMRILKKVEESADKLDPTLRANVLLDVARIYKDM